MILNLPHYQEINKLYTGTRTVVYRAIRVTDDQSVVIKALQNPYPNFNELVQFLNQYVITRNLEHPGIVKPLALEPYGNGYALVMPDDGAIALSDYWQQSSRSLSEFLTIAIQLAETLHYLIQQRLIHKDIKPANILIHPETRQVKLIDFSISSLLPKEQQQLTNPNGLEGTLAYISPEQTGRMNRGIDYRTDFYSLGVSFFELLTGKLPFETSDPMELVHCHIAQSLPTPHTPHPTPIFDIVLKLMAKNAEERYQSALGLKHDLERCRQQLDATGDITPFELGERDICDRFLISEKLYGREAQVQTLLDAFERVTHGSSEIMLVAGFSGIGKTAVINEVHKPILKQRAYFIKGKFDQFNRNIPFWAFVQAFRDLMGQLMSDSDQKLANWQEKILAAVGEKGQVIIDVIPELEGIIGKQSPVPELLGSAAQNRFHLLFGKFVRVFTTKEHPLVIFLDDLQWADSASLNLLKRLMEESEAGYLLVLGAYRDNEVFAAHPLMLTLEELKKAEKPLNTITLAPLTFHDTNQLVADTLHCSTERSHPLTSLLFRKTQGNPFFTNQFLKALHEDGHIKFNSQEGYWQCDIAQVNTLSLTDDVVEFMAQQLRKLPSQTQEVLKLAACIGNEFDLETLAIVSQQSPTITAKALWAALQEGLILTTGQSYKFFQAEETEPSNSDGSVNLLYRFLHDRVQQAAYCLIPDNQKQQTHLQIGRLLHAQADQGKHLFEILNHMNESAALIVEEEERRLLRKLNLVGCQRAKLATAYGAAVDYANAAMGLLPADAWASEYDYILALYEAAAEAAYLNTDFATAEGLIETILSNTQEFIEGIKAYELLVQIYIAKDQQIQAIETGLEALKKLGICLVDSSDWQEQLPPLPTEQTLATQPEMTNPAYLAALRILITITPPTHHVKPELFPAVVLTMVGLCDRDGFSSLAAYTYGIYGLLLCALVEDPDTAHRSGKLSLQLLEQFQAHDLRTKVNMLFAVFVCACKEAGQATLPLLKQGIEVGFEVGDIEYVSYCIMAYFSHLFLVGKPLEEIEESRQIYLSALDQFKQKHCIEYSNLWLQVAEEFTGTAIAESAESSILKHFETTHNHQCLFAFHLSKLISSYTFAEHERALDHAVKALASQEAAFGVLLTAAHGFYHALALLATFNPELTSVQQQALLEQIATNLGKLEQLSAHAPSNYQHKLDLVTAEKYRILGQKTLAIEYYDRAIAGAKENRYIQEEALAHELAAKFYLDWGKEKIAAVYMQETYYCYARWGAKAKTDHLEQIYPQLLTPILQQPQPPLNFSNCQTSTQNFGSVTTATSVLDLISVIRASQALSEEIELDALLSKLMHIVIENAGADEGALILNNSGTWEIAAQCVNGNCHLSTIPLDQTDNLPSSIINTVKRTQQTLLINNIEQDKTFTRDPYLMQQQPQSLCCTPILNQGKLVGILYLENNLTAETFTPDRIKVLNLLTTQAAISIENARLYQRVENYNRTLEQQVAERTQQLQHKNQELAQTLQELKATQDGLIQSEKMAALGQLVAGIAHEINTPLGAIRAAIGNTDKALEASLAQFPQLLPQLNPQQQADFFSVLEQALGSQPSLSTREKRQIKRTLTQQLEAQEIENAKQLAHLLTEGGLHHSFDSQLSLLQTPQAHQIVQIAYDIARLHANSQTINNAVERASKIVFALKSYARYDHSGEKQLVQITGGIETVLDLYHNYLKKGVTVIRNYQPVPEIYCYPDELVQVWTNLIHNAVQAIDSKGTIEIGVRQQNQEIVVEVTDSGCGIPLEIQEKIFQPFFTTKSAGEGSGLGLDIVQKIIEKHQGTITFTSVPGNTTFTVTLPI